MATNPVPKAWLLDVGHGNSAIVQAGGCVSIIDGGRGDTLVQFLSNQGIYSVDTVVVSHADADHFGGISLLLLDKAFHVKRVFINPDQRQTDLWEDFAAIIEDAKQRGTEFYLELTSTNPGIIAYDGVSLEILAPSQNLAYRTNAGRSVDGTRLTANSMSAVVRVWAGNSPRLLITGDMDQVAFDSPVEHGSDLRAEVLIFPHHGGLPGRSDPTAFTESLLTAVYPQLVVFSIGRGQHKTPRPEIVSAALRVAKNVHIACTQLSTNCADTLPLTPTDIHAATAKGNGYNACCAGTMEISLGQHSRYVPTRNDHLDFIMQHAPKALCRVLLPNQGLPYKA